MTTPARDALISSWNMAALDCSGLLSRLESAPDGWTVGVAACARGAGATTVSCNLALAASEDRAERTLLVDAHLRCPILQRLFELPDGPGVGDLMLAPALPESLPVRLTKRSSLDVLPAGRVSAPASQWAAFPDLLAAAAADYRQIVVDLPTAGVCSACPALLHPLDGVVLVVQAGRTRRAEVSEACEALQASGGRVLCVALNRQARLPCWLQRLLGPRDLIAEY